MIDFIALCIIFFLLFWLFTLSIIILSIILKAIFKWDDKEEE